jgi:hypothetical protein
VKELAFGVWSDSFVVRVGSVISGEMTMAGSARVLRPERRAKELAKEPEQLKAWRRRMDDPAAQEIYRRRSRIELVNAHMKNRGFGRLNLRGLVKAAGVLALWHALAYNILVARRLRGVAP